VGLWVIVDDLRLLASIDGEQTIEEACCMNEFFLVIMLPEIAWAGVSCCTRRDALEIECFLV
jgi:hypothetical protein